MFPDEQVHGFHRFKAQHLYSMVTEVVAIKRVMALWCRVRHLVWALRFNRPLSGSMTNIDRNKVYITINNRCYYPYYY